MSPSAKQFPINQPMIISYIVLMAVNSHPDKQMDFCHTESTNSQEEGSTGI